MRPVGWKSIALLAGFLAVTSCGGNGGAAGSGGTATPTTPGSASVPASPAYADATDFTRDRSFTGIGLRLLSDRRSARTDTRLDPENATIGFGFIAAPKTYQTRYDGDLITAVTQPTATNPPYDQFSGANSGLARMPLVLGYTAANVPTTATYFGFVRWFDNDGAGVGDSGTRSTTRYILFGARTVAGDLPTIGSATSTGSASLQGGPSGGYGDVATITIDYAARTITASTAFNPYSTGGTGSSTRPLPAAEPITLIGTFDAATGRISGIATHAPTGTTGRFEGALYGPRGVEAGLLFSITTASGVLYYGVVGGRV